ncbi:uncharacterized protein LOC142587855 isoform X2 [Dermacentor variabilis]|uniref:uncharacterized protein LOC142587855 isoform X2 n=1 Tax=Dermacentor variabilis TaxID=34621 RepID=UPI003F5BA582
MKVRLSEEMAQAGWKPTIAAKYTALCFLIFLPAALSGYVKGEKGRISLPVECHPHCVVGKQGACFIPENNLCQCYCVEYVNHCEVVRRHHHCPNNQIHLCNNRGDVCECSCVPTGLW